ncbi:hypothetical protein DL239_09230 [Sedimentitalea sp. CY04]|uniref:CENP-V/GFA domain-containing protein n=1 Tax=Parasedimentitalea denitrificans TaxID=2211118 RepID=A0ABX0W7B3_9RHOB|nr:GFA family protein [Sedimentitalea sp. CY04]NIZ61158.1 hypothetical protein [Sedimentitalea sp. CY04]
MTTGGTQIWQGACHCRRTRFSVKADIDHTRICDCSICHQRGALIFRVEEEQFTLHTPLSDLTLYEWGTGTAKDYFCKTCGILPFRRPRAVSEEELSAGNAAFNGWAINLRCIEGLDISDLPIQKISGRLLK